MITFFVGTELPCLRVGDESGEFPASFFINLYSSINGNISNEVALRPEIFKPILPGREVVKLGLVSWKETMVHRKKLTELALVTIATAVD